MNKNVIHHLVTVDPPNVHRRFWFVYCSYNENGRSDLNRQYRTRLEALEAAHSHVLEVTTRSALEQGYEFDDGPMRDGLSPEILYLLEHGKEIE